MLFKNDNIPDWLKQANNNYMKEQSQDNAVADFFARHNFTKQPEREEAPGFFAGVQSGIAGVLGGQARFGEVNSPLGGETLGKAADYFENMQRENARDKFTDGAELSWDYITDPQGLRYDVGNTVGSGAALGAETAAVAAAVAHSPLAAGAAAVGRALPVVAKLWNSPLGKVVVGNVAQTPLEAISEGGNLVPELRQAGYSEDEIQEIANRAAALNIGGLGLSNLIQSYGAGKVLGLLRSGAGKATASEIAKRGLLGAVGGGISNAGEEGMQSAIGDIAIGRPIDWGEVESSARTGFASGSVLGGIGGAGGSYIQNRRAQNAEQAESEQPAAGANLINRVRALEGQIPYEAPDGTNCMRTLGLALAGTPYENQINVDQAIATATANGQLMNPAEYTPQPGDLAVVNNGNHIVMVTENGGTIQNGASHNGVYESEQSPADMFGGVQYYIRTSDYNNGRAGVGRRDLRSMYADENDTAEVVVPEQRVIPARGFDTNIADEQAADSEQSTAYNEDEITRRIAERINENSSLTDEALDAIAGNRGAWTDGVSGVEFNDGSRRARTATVGRSAGTPASVSIATPALNRLRGGRQRTRTQANLNSSRQDYIDELNRRELNARIDQLNVENQQVEPPRANNSRLTALIRRARSGRTGSGSVENALRSNSLQRLTERAMSGDHSAERSFAGLRPDVRAALLGRHTARLEAQNREAEANVSREALRASEAQQAERQQAQQQEILREAEQYFRESYSDPLQGVRRELRDARANVEKLLEPVLDSLREGAGNGYSLVPGTEEGRMVRMSNNAPWYQEFRRTYGRKPNKGELVQIAREIYSGTNSYGVPGWERTQESEAEFARNREQLAELDEFINTYEQLEERFAAEQKNGGINNGENALDNENNNQNSEPQESQQSGQTREEGKNAEAEKEITAPSEQDNDTNDFEQVRSEMSEYIKNLNPTSSKMNKLASTSLFLYDKLQEKRITPQQLKQLQEEASTAIGNQQSAPAKKKSSATTKKAPKAQPATKKEPANRFDGSRAESALDKLIGRKQPKQQEQQTGKKFMNVFDESELEAEIAKAKAEMSKLSANPFFNPALMKSLFKIGGIYMQRGVNNFTGWSERMVETLGSKVRPFLKSAWDALQAYPSDVKFNDDIMTATLEFVGSRVDDGRSRDEIRNEFTEMYGDEYVAYVDAAYEGVNSYPTEIAENADVVEETATDENEEPAQEIQSVSGDARVMESGDSSGIPDIFSTSEESWLGPDGRKTYYDLRSPKGESFARRIPEEIQKKYGIVKQIPLIQLSFDSAEGRKRFANDWVEGKIEEAKRSVELANREAEEKREKEAAAARMRADLPEATFNLNEAQNGIEIKFASKPSEEVRRGLKEARFRWSQPKQLWYARQTPEAMAFAESIGYVPGNMVQSNQETNEAPSVPAAEKATQQPAAQEREAVINGNDNDTGRHRAVSENLPAGEVQGTESERTTERVREPEVEGRGVQVTGDNGRAAGERPVSGERRPAGESAAQSGTGSNSEGTSERGSVRSLRPAQKKKAKASEVPGHNFTITADENIGKGGAKTKYKDNVAAIKLLKQLEAEDRLATPEEQKVLARYVGWGGLAPVFSYGRDSAWESEKAELRELLTDEEYNAARGSTNNAHYTSPEVIKGVWDIIERLGFKGGKVLEPSMGIGNFFGMMPEKLRSKSSLNGVELDSLTGRIAKQLYQKASVEITGYEQTKYPDDYFDLAISNVPFGQFSLHDPKYNKFKFNIHNYFFAKAIDQVRPGGLVAFITSTGTMQSGSDAKRLRELLKNKADFIGAVRLPNTAFKENAGTEVTTDLIVLQKREPGAAPGKNNHAWLETKDSELTGKYTQQPLQINEYYSEHPEMLIGKLTEDTLYGGGRLALDGTGLNVGKELEGRVEKFPKNIYKPRSTNRNTNSLESAYKFLAPSGTRNGQFVIADNGVFVNDNGEMVELPKAAQARAKDYVGLREATKKILDGQINPNVADKTLDAWRKDLNKVYDKFVAKYGYLNSPKNKRDLAQDPDFGIVSAIEKYTLDKKTKKESAAKADIFTKRTVNPIIKIDKADNPSDALALSLSNTGAVDIDYMADLTGQKPADVVKALKGFIYKDPATNTYVTAEEYLSGNVREKLEIAEFWGKTDPEAAANIEALKKVQPVDLTPEEISVNLGTPWIPESDLRDFAQEMLGMPSWEQPLDIRFNKPAGTWLVAWNRGWRADEAKHGTEATQKWGTPRRNFANLLDDALNQRTPTVYDTSSDGKRSVNQQETLAAQQKLREIQDEFKKWIWKDKDRAERLAAYYNRNFNNIRLREYNGSMLTLPGYSSVAPPLKQHQKDAVWRIIQDGTALLAHTVGAGKTWTMQTAAMELKRLGIVNKSMFVIPNHMLQQFENEFRIIYPNAKLLTISSENLPDVPPPAKKGDTAEAKKRRAAKIAERQKILSRIATEDWDGIIISHNMFKRIPMSPEAYNAFYQEQIDNMRTAILELTGEGDRNSNRLVKKLEKKAKSLEEKLKRDMNEENKDIAIPFEQLGIDEIFVDEADLFKNLFFVTKMNRIGGLSNTNSQRSLDMYMKTQYLAKHNNGRGIVFATGTPISNTMAEMFTMLRYLDGKGLKENDLDFFDNWAAQFAERETVIERSPDGQGWRQAEKFTKFKNMPELIKMFRKVADVKTQADLNLDIPKLKNGKPTVIEVEPNSALTDYIKNTAKERAQKIHDRQVDPSEDTMLKLTGDLRKASLDMRLIDPTVPASVAGGKLKAVAENVYKKYKESNSTKGAQLVFCDLSTPKGTSDKVVETDGAVAPEAAEDGENVTAYEEIKKSLVKQGVPPEEVAFIHDAKTKEQKEELFAKVRDGRVRVLIGSTEKMGAGTNVQQKLVALHHVDAPWRPRDIEQREGRILRQGNENAEVEIFNYVTKDSFDANMWEKLKNKATMIAQALSNNLSGRTLEDADANVLSFAEIESLASGNPLVAERVAVNAELNKYEALYASYRKNQTANERKASNLPATIEYNKTIADNAKADIKNRSSIEGDKFSITLGKKVFNKRADAKAALEAYASNKSGVARTVGKIGGFELRLRPLKAGESYSQDGNIFAAQEGDVKAELIGKNTYTCEAALGSIEYAVMHAPEKTLDRAERNVESSEKELKAVQAELAEPFKYLEKYEELKKRSAEIDAELGITDAAGNTQYNATTEPAALRSSEEVLSELQDALPNGKFEDAGNGEYTVTLPNNARFKVNVADRIAVNANEAAAARSAHGIMDGNKINIEGSWTSFNEGDVNGLLNLSRTGRAGTAYHEVMHAAMDLALTDKEQQAMVKHFNKEAQATGKTVSEAISDGYVEWKRARAQRRGTLFGKLFNKMQDMLNTLKSLFTGIENAHNVMRRVESGEVWQRANRSGSSRTNYSAKNLTPEQKAAQAFTNTERKTTWQSAKDWAKKQRTEFYRDWIDKNDSLHGLDEAIEMTTGIKTDGDQSVYNRVQTLPATAAGMANALIEGNGNSLKALNERLKNKKLPHNVTMQMVLENINREKMDKAHPNYLKRGGFNNWIDAFGAYLGSIRLNEMLLLHDEAYQQKVKEWESGGKKGKKPENKPYLLPKGLTQTDIESVIKNAPPEFRKAAQMYWQFNNNILTVMEDAGLISSETHKLLNTKYKYYCPLMRDFSDTAAADNFINGLSNGGRGIGNVSSMLRRISIEGSERNVINPLESTVKAVAVMCNRAERNKVGQMAVELAQKGGLDAVIQEAEGTVADPKNCIFTVMFDGEKKAYKTTQELYGPIVGYNLPAAGFVLGVARNAARLLRAGATTSPSFIIRNLIRDTVFAGVSSKNGFTPIVDTIRGAYALARDPRLRAEFKVAGVTQFNFYSSSEQIVKSLDEMAGGKAWKDYGAADIWRALMKYPALASEFVESSTRMGEFMKARKKGASLEEAAQAARELTLDFSRSGVQGEKVNQIVPFFNAVLQGGDKMVRLIKQDPVGTGTKLAMYIVLPSLALWALNHDEDWYKEIDPEVKVTCWLLPGGLRVPKPQEAGILFGSGIEAVLDQAFDKDPEAISNWAKVFGGNIAPSIMPTIFLPLLEWQANYSFFRGQSITPQRLQNLPDELQYTPNTSAAARTLGSALKLSPVKIDNTIRGYTGTMGMTLVQQLDWFADEKQNMPYKKVSEWPFLRDFTVNQNIQNRSVDDFYKMLRKANEQHAGYGKKGKPTPAVQGVRKAGQLISKAQKDIRELTVNPRLSPEAKRQRIDQKKTYIKNVANKANNRFGKFFED